VATCKVGVKPPNDHRVDGIWLICLAGKRNPEDQLVVQNSNDNIHLQFRNPRVDFFYAV